MLWNYIDAHQLTFLHDLFHGDWGLIGTYVNHDGYECRRFWEKCMCLPHSGDDRLTMKCTLSGDSMAAIINGRSQLILTTDEDSEIVNILIYFIYKWQYIQKF